MSSIIESEIKHNSAFMTILFLALCTELALINIGVPGKLIPNFVMCVVFSFAYVKPVQLWLVTLSVIIGESFFSSTPTLMTLMILSLYSLITYHKTNFSLIEKNFHLVSFVLITLIVYSVKILWLVAIEFKPDLTFTIIKMLVTVLLFPLFYLSTAKIVKLYT